MSKRNWKILMHNDHDIMLLQYNYFQATIFVVQSGRDKNGHILEKLCHTRRKTNYANMILRRSWATIILATPGGFELSRISKLSSYLLFIYHVVFYVLVSFFCITLYMNDFE